MCTLIVLHRCIEATALVVAANRDEFFERPAEGPALRHTAHGKVLAPRDAQAGGTWLGLNEHGLFAAITNRRSESAWSAHQGKARARTSSRSRCAFTT